MTLRRVMLFGLSADPPTGAGGHAGIVTWAAARPGIDEVWVLPVFRHAFAEKRQMTPYPHRLAMARLAFEHLPGLEGRVRVVEAERHVTEELEARARLKGADPTQVFVGTLDVVGWLVGHHRDTRFALVLGADTYRDYLAGLWKGGQTLGDWIPVIGLPRAGVDLPVDPTSSTRDLPRLNDVSSRALRASVDPALWEREVQPQIREYVLAHHLYLYGGAK